MTARRHPTSFVFATLTALGPSAEAPRSVGLWPRTLGRPLLAPSVEERAPEAAPEPAPDALDPSLTPGARRILELARQGSGARPAPELVLVLAELGTFLEILPLARLTAVELTSARLELAFDVPHDRTIPVELPSTTLHVLACDEDDESDPLRRGRALRIKTEEKTLLVHRRVRFELGPAGIASVREGDLEVEAGPFAFDLAVRTERRIACTARDHCGRPVLEVDERGVPLRRDGRWVPATYDLWVVLEAFGRRVEVGVAARPARGP